MGNGETTWVFWVILAAGALVTFLLTYVPGHLAMNKDRKAKCSIP